MAERERERESDGEKDKDRQKRKGETSGRENLSDMEMTVPAAYGTKHFPPCNLLSADESKRTLQADAR